MYVAGLVIPVPGDRMEAYRKWAENSAQFFREYGCLEIVECWEDFTAAEKKMPHDPRMDSAGDPPFDAKRLILGCFTPLLSIGRD